MDVLAVAKTPTYGREMLSRRMRECAEEIDHPLEILEAGCGRAWNIDLAGVPHRLTGIDLDGEALAHRRDDVGDLDVAIVGDLRTTEIPQQAFDVVFCAFVLEHIRGAEHVLDRLVAAVRPGGRLVIRTPDGDSVYGWLARRLPFRLHVLYKRIAEHNPRAGTPGNPPYPVVYDELVRRSGFHDYFHRNGLEIVEEVGTNPHLAFAPRAVRPLGWFGQRLIAALSFGRLAGTHSNLQFVIRVPRRVAAPSQPQAQPA